VYTCVSTTSDSKHCGACSGSGSVCASNKTCINSQCWIHSTGLGQGWNDSATAKTYNATEALTACQTYDTANGLGSGNCTSSAAQCPGYSGATDGTIIWWYAVTGGGTAVTPGEVTSFSCSASPTSLGTWY
jgi:hypothetical protein